MLALALGIRFASADGSLTSILLFGLGVAFVAFPLAQWWATATLPLYEGDTSTLVPLRRFEAYERQARAMGPGTLTGFVILSGVLAVPQAIVVVQDGVWWAWLGLAMFAGSGVYFARMRQRIRAEERAARAT
jgi:hypothetical protein